MSADPLVIDIPLRWSDMDAYAHVNNTRFLTLLEEARIMGLERWFGHHGMLESGVLVSRHEIDYLAQLTYRLAPVEVAIWCGRIGASSFEMAYEVRDPASVGSQRYAVAETTLVTFDNAAGHTRRLTEEERAVLETFRGEPAPLRRRRGSGGDR